MIPEMPPQRSAKPGLAPSSLIERAAQHLDWTIAFGTRHNSVRGLEETTNQQSRPDPQGMARAPRPGSSGAGRYRLLSTSRLCLASVVVLAGAGTGVFLLTHGADEKATAIRALATEAPARASEPTSLIRGMAMMPPAASTAPTAALAGQASTPSPPEWEAKLSFGSPFSPPGWPKSEVAATPAKPLEATSTVAPPAPRNQPTVPTLSAAGLLARGDWLVATGDIAAARLLYERAADAGEPRAAVKLGESFDPVYLDGSHLRGLQGDRDMAVLWYRHARDLGATGVASRLKKLEAKEGKN